MLESLASMLRISLQRFAQHDNIGGDITSSLQRFIASALHGFNALTLAT
jgi:hypothetical protein